MCDLLRHARLVYVCFYDQCMIYAFTQVFDNIRSIDADQLHKIHIIKGDVTLDDLGMDETDRAELEQNVNVVFHCAANVRFDQPIKEAVNMNTLGTQRVLQLAERMHDLKVSI